MAYGIDSNTLFRTLSSFSRRKKQPNFAAGVLRPSSIAYNITRLYDDPSFSSEGSIIQSAIIGR